MARPRVKAFGKLAKGIERVHLQFSKDSVAANLETEFALEMQPKIFSLLSVVKELAEWAQEHEDQVVARWC